MTKKAIKLVQEYLKDQGHYKRSIDGICGPKTLKALDAALKKKDAGRFQEEWHKWPKKRKLIVCLQLICEANDIDAGPSDGYWGQRTDYGYDSLIYLKQYGSLPDSWRDPQPTIVNPNEWPSEEESDLVNFYGDVGTNIVMVELPYTHRLSWDKRQKLSKFACHEKVHDSIQRILGKVLDHYGEEKIKELRLDLFGGCYNKRRMRGGSCWSTHAWGMALDYDPDRNRLKWGRDRAAFAKPSYEKWWEFWQEEGWVSLGREKNYDWMHIQAAQR